MMGGVAREGEFIKHTPTRAFLENHARASFPCSQCFSGQLIKGFHMLGNSKAVERETLCFASLAPQPAAQIEKGPFQGSEERRG